ncbi:unnamed protein product [Rotaria socialis]|uniref:MULE transposase domain-containing protein n=3 Tax=Rotaria socialis TaxID=392032 RepID=A0A820EKZ6_9BILA|nr:unnamed protein product [Rotaria socialis]CAF3661664.1 unnamed protein product [Rotaria socialis]CAF4250284.1 unnamed protein product [Rotaria socialis]CAF4524985.1 unnamed protein product [Rotaria socialis]
MSTQAIKKFKTEKGKDMLSYEGYIYTLERKTDVKLIFRYQRRDCKGRCHTNPTMDAILSGPTEHCHAPTPDLVPVFELKSKIKARAAETEEFPSTILHSVMRSFPLDAAGQLPQGDTLLRTIRRQRPAPSTNNDNQLPDNLKQTDRGENFVLHEDEKLIIFTTGTNLSVLKTCKHWFVDGTFKVCPEDFYQMFTLHGLYKSQVIPLVYGLLVGKKTTDYDHFFRRIMDEDDFDSETILSDFEAATIKSINSLFPNIVHKGCLFHFGQCIWRQIQSHGLQKKYQEDKSFHLDIKKLIALAFVPVLDVIKAFDLIVDDFDDDADDFLGYFEKTWIGEPKKRGTGRKKPLFTIELWNVYDRIVANLPRSDNSIEGWHNAFAKRVAIVHPSVSKLTEKVRREQSKFELDIAQIRQGQEPKPKKLKY